MAVESAAASGGLRLRAGPARAARRLVCNVLLALLSIALGLAACEAALRLFHPRYQLAATPRDLGHTHKRVANPDTGTEHHVIHNNLGGRQSRDFSADSLDAAVNIAFFGDSETENLHLPAQYSYTEPLDYLLNNVAAPEGAAKGVAFNVLNFGVWGWNTGRSYLRWRSLPERRKLAHVLYLVVGNDLDGIGNVIDAGIVLAGESGEIRGGAPPRTPAWKRLLPRSHLTYLVVDVWQRFAGEPLPDAAAGEADRNGGPALSRGRMWSMFRALMRRWQREVEADGGAFHMVLMPKNAGLYRLIRGDAALRTEVDLVDLRECFREVVPGFDYADWRFVNDPHWNSAGNMMAASCLYRHLEGALGLPKRGDEELRQARHSYYEAFLNSSAWQGERYMPDAMWAWPSERGAEPRETGAAVVAKYLALELAPARNDRWREAVGAARAAGAVATSAWDVYANPQERLLVYVKNPCPATPPAVGSFFLHAVPFTPEKLPVRWRRFGFINLDHSFVNLDYRPFSLLRRNDSGCVFSVPLPDYPLTTVRTGRFVEHPTEDGEDLVYTNLWSEEFRMPLARQVWDVFASVSGRGLDYVQEPCDLADTAARFFLHVFPLRPADLRGLPAAGVLRRYANLDFAWDGTGVYTDGACRISVPLPDFPIDFVRTGQFREGVVSSKRLWSARIDFAEVERKSPQPDRSRTIGAVSP